MSETTVIQREQSRIGRSLQRLDAFEKVTGQAVYTSDLRLPGMLYAKILRSDVPHARLKGIDTSQALAMPGVKAVVTGQDLNDIDPYYGAAIKDQPILSIDTIRYHGEPVAAVVADDLASAEAALQHIQVECQELPIVNTLDEALEPAATILHQTFRTASHFRDLKEILPIPGTNVCHHYKHRQGDVESGFERADKIFEDTYELPAVHHYPLEPYNVLAEAGRNHITVWSGTQHPFHVRKELSEIFGVPLSRVRLIVPYIGGAFGARCYTKLEPLAACLARKVNRPVKLVTTVEEAFLTITRHAARTRVKTGVMADGTLVAREIEIHLDTGAYADVGPRVAKKAGYRAIGPYGIPNLKVDSYAVYTNKVPAGAYRGYGAPQGVWAVECQMDDIASSLKIDPLSLRLRNFRHRGEDYVPGDTPVDGEIQDTVKKVAEAVRWPEPSPRGRGKGLACGMKDGGGTHTVSMATVRIHVDASVTVQTASVEFGQASHTSLAQIVAEELGVSLDQVAVEGINTSIAPYDQGTSASRTITLMGDAVQKAARHARHQLVSIAAALMKCAADGLWIENARVIGPNASLTFAEVIRAHYGLAAGEIIGTGVFRPTVFEGSLGGAVTFWEIGAGAAEIEVDFDTGVITPLQYVSGTDVGKAINPLQVEGQDEGAAMQALGHTLLEGLVYEGGQLLNGNLVEYRVPSFENLPEHFGTVVIENQDGPGPYGSKGMGEGGVLSVAPAIGNALCQATGIRIRHLPLTPEVVWKALASRQPTSRETNKK